MAYATDVSAEQFDKNGNYYEPKPPVTVAVFKTYPVLVAEAVVPTAGAPFNFTRYKEIDITKSIPAGPESPPSSPGLMGTPTQIRNLRRPNSAR